jgi:hypothetical protein
MINHGIATEDVRGAFADSGDQLALPLIPGKRPRRLLWVDGVNSAVMAHLMLMEDPDAQPVHCDLGDSVDTDSHRFVNDLEQWYGKAIIRIRSERYKTIDEVFEARHYLSGRNGAPCTGEMKFAPRMDFQLPSDIHFWGYAADKLDAKRFGRLSTAMLPQDGVDLPEGRQQTQRYPSPASTSPSSKVFTSADRGLCKVHVPDTHAWRTGSVVSCRGAWRQSALRFRHCRGSLDRLAADGQRR